MKYTLLLLIYYYLDQIFLCSNELFVSGYSIVCNSVKGLLQIVFDLYNMLFSPHRVWKKNASSYEKILKNSNSEAKWSLLENYCLLSVSGDLSKSLFENLKLTKFLAFTDKCTNLKT